MALFGGEFGEDRDAEHFGGELLGNGDAVEAAILVVHEALLAVERDRVIDLAADLARGEESLERVAPAVRDAERELVPDALAGEVDRQQDLRALVGAGAVLGDAGAPFSAVW